MESLKTDGIKFGSTIPNIIFDKFMNMDWSSTYKFLYKMCELYDGGYSEQSIITLFKKYKFYEKYIKSFDITTATFDDIEEVIEKAKTTKSQSCSYIEDKLKTKILVYSRDNYKLYKIHNFSEMEYVSKSTPWCIGLNEDEYNMYAERYNIYVLCDYSEMDIVYRKMCIMLSKNEGVDMIVTTDNVHHYSNSDDYTDIVTKYIPKEIADLLLL